MCFERFTPKLNNPYVCLRDKHAFTHVRSTRIDKGEAQQIRSVPIILNVLPITEVLLAESTNGISVQKNTKR